MSEEARELTLILEKVYHLQDYETFSLYLKLEGYEWSFVGEYSADELPTGSIFDFDIPIVQLLKSPFLVDLKIITKKIFVGRLQLKNDDRMMCARSRGLSVLFESGIPESVLYVSLCLLVQDPTLVRVPLVQNLKQTQRLQRPTSASIPCQTSPKLTKSMRIQCDISSIDKQRRNTIGCNTDVHLLTSDELRGAVANSVLKHMKAFSHEDQFENERKFEEIEGSRPSQLFTIPAANLGFNIVPRMQQLRVLHKIIENKSNSIRKMETNLVVNRINQKRDAIRKARNSVYFEESDNKKINAIDGLKTQLNQSKKALTFSRKTDKKQAQVTIIKEIGNVVVQAENAVKIEEKDKPPSTLLESSRTSSSSSVTTEEKSRETSQQSSSVSKDDDEEKSDSSSSEASASTCNSETLQRFEPVEKESSIEDPFSPRARTSLKPKLTRAAPIKNPVEPPLSPTSQYIEDLKERVLAERIRVLTTK